MAKQKYFVTSINFGKKGELSREIIEQLLKKVGKIGLSKEIRNAVVFYFSNNKNFNEAKINQLINQRKEIKARIPEISRQLEDNEKSLNKLGFKLEE
jgi:hypothetical protein